MVVEKYMKDLKDLSWHSCKCSSCRFYNAWNIINQAFWYPHLIPMRVGWTTCYLKNRCPHCSFQKYNFVWVGKQDIREGQGEK